MKVLEYDVAVFGGGLAGISVAVNAYRNGRTVILVEQSFTLGGNSTIGLVNPFMRYWLNGEVLAGSFFLEILEELGKRGGLKINSFDSEILKIILFEKLKDIPILFRAMPIDVEIIDKRIERVVVATSLGNKYLITAKLFVDATGDGTLSYLSQCDYESGQNGENQATTLMFTLSNVNFDKVRESVRNNPSNFFAWVSADAEILSVGGYFEEVRKAREDGLYYPNDYFFFVELPGGNSRVSVNTTHIFAKTTDDFELANAMKLGHKQVETVYQFAKNYVPGFEECYIEKIGQILGIRESRRIKGLYMFSGSDVTSGARFEDGVVKACYGIDVHRKEVKLSDKDKKEVPAYKNYYQIPVRSLISKDYENLAIVGRNFSGDFAGHSAARIMPTCTDMGEAIGKLCGMVQKSFYEILKKD
ncbi:MAG: FAD-dependent oxidoreductase [Fervidobacterium sp.]|uniref:FAD-dependent oxidoreductase n=1 Tax=Fervidobacterium sp. TaxID=1871331 RepID=UPI0040498978